MATVAQILGWSCGFREWIQCLAHQTGVITSTTMGFGLASPVSIQAGDSSRVIHSPLAGATGTGTNPNPQGLSWCWLRGTKPSSSSPSFMPAGVFRGLMPSHLPFLLFSLCSVGKGWRNHCGSGQGMVAVTPQETFSYFGALVIPALKITHPQQICRWSKGHPKQPSAACELILDASLGDLHREHHPHLTKMGTTWRV